MRISGLASGLDIDSMVRELMKSRRASYDTMVKKRIQVEWQREDYRTISTKIVDFRNNKLSSFNLSSAINAKTAEISGADPNAIQLNATSSTAGGTLNVKVEKLATAETRVYDFGPANSSATLASLGFASDPAVDGNVQITINGEKISLSGDATLKELSNAINAKSSKTKATALYNAETGQFSISATATGTDKLQMNFPALPEEQITITPGEKGRVFVNGILYEQDSNRFSLNGVDFTVKAESASPITISVVQDTGKIVDTIKSFIEEYNNLISLINGELSEEKNRKFLPLTSDEKAALTEKEVEMWESKARSGMLRNDSTLSKYVSDLRLIVTSLVGGIQLDDGSSLSIGITTGSYSEKGKLVLDEEKLRNALESNPNEVVSLFSGSNGVFKQMMDKSMSALTDLSKIAGTSITSADTSVAFMASSLMGEQLRNMESRESLMLMRLNNLEVQYYKQFTAMETAINRFNSQASSIASFF